MQMRYSKCSLGDLGTCDDYEVAKFDNICDRFSDKNAFWTPLMKIIKPKLFCPIKKVTSKVFHIWTKVYIFYYSLQLFRVFTLFVMVHSTCRWCPCCLLMVIMKITICNKTNEKFYVFKGFRYITTIAFYEMVKNSTKPLQLMCLDSDVSITLQSNGRHRNKGNFERS